MKTMGKEAVMINKEMIDLRYVEQIVRQRTGDMLDIVCDMLKTSYERKERSSSSDRRWKKL